MGEPAKKEREKQLTNKERLQEKNGNNKCLILLSSGDMFVIAEVKKLFRVIVRCCVFWVNCYYYFKWTFLNTFDHVNCL